ncbi:kelch-like protein 20 isoform X2 [Cynoglossus semilaevis]|uniref:kelch-like protein 20 isoform X2 n=1 Tax=Cynoglossus semilaevis TaxID=244447 RepID=UPI000D626D3B|nr:kelch-like protein 20 isoform X2 [Cynoglossus semilaevis]
MLSGSSAPMRTLWHCLLNLSPLTVATPASNWQVRPSIRTKCVLDLQLSQLQSPDRLGLSSLGPDPTSTKAKKVAAVEAPKPDNMLIKHQQRQTSTANKTKVVENRMFVVGGWTQEDPSCLVEQFCSEYNEWRTAARMLKNRGAVAVGTLSGQIYAVGGEDSIRCYNSVERYSPDTDSWSTDVAPLSSPRSGVCLVEMDGYLYAIGGHDGITAMNTVERYDLKTNSWSKQSPMLTRRNRAAAAVLGGYLYVIGGNDGHTVLNSVERYSPADGTWTTCSYMRCPRENAGCCVYLGHIYVGGGKDQLSLQLCAMERFDPETMTWSPVKHMRSKRDSMSLVVFNGVLLAVGGCDGTTNLKTIEAYSHETNTWRHFGSMKSKHPGGRVAVLC